MKTTSLRLNKVRAGIVEKAKDYIYSSASNYSFGKGLIEVEIADNQIVNTRSDGEFWKYNNYE